MYVKQMLSRTKKSAGVCDEEKDLKFYFALYLGASETSDQYNLKNGF